MKNAIIQFCVIVMVINGCRNLHIEIIKIVNMIDLIKVRVKSIAIFG